jgi:predicted Fe-Mo cluster-binding NifX family protein
MIIGIPTDDGRHVSEHFGRARHFMIVDVRQGAEPERRLVENPHDKEQSEQSGHGKLLKMLVENKVGKVICFNLNPKMEKNLGSLKIVVQRCGEDSEIDSLLKAA